MTRFVTTVSLLGLLLIASISFADGATIKRSYVDLDWGQIHLRTAHPVNACHNLPVVCFAPTPYSGNYYELLMQGLAQDRLVIAPDYPGLGQSDRPDKALDIADHADIMAEVLIAAGWGPDGRDPVDACGYHTGTFIATELALRHPAHTKPVRREGFTPGNAVLLFNTDGLKEKWSRIENAPGVEIISKPKLTTYPGYGGVGMVRVLVSKFYDADGYILEVNQILRD